MLARQSVGILVGAGCLWERELRIHLHVKRGGDAFAQVEFGALVPDRRLFLRSLDSSYILLMVVCWTCYGVNLVDVPKRKLFRSS